MSSTAPVFAVLLPIAGAMLAPILGRTSRSARNVVLVVACAVTAALAFSFVPATMTGEIREAYLLRVTPQIWLHLRVDALGVLFGATVAGLWVLVLVYSLSHMADSHRLNRFYAFLMLCLGCMMGVAYAGNLLTFLIFYELFSILTYPLIVHDETPAALAAGTKYIVYILIGGSLVLVGVVFTYFVAGDQTLTAGGLLGSETDVGVLRAIFWCFIAGFGVKAAIVPLHGWVPDAHPAAPAPFSAVLSGVMVAAGTFGIARVVFQVFGIEILTHLGVMPYVAAFAAFTVFFAAVLAVSEDGIKRRLAYSTISQMGYVTLGIALLGAGAAVGALVHITNHAFMKGALFLCAGLLSKRAGIRSVSEMAGVARRMPWTMAAFSLASLGMIGTPPLAGFISKWYLGLGILDAGQPFYLAVLLGGSLIAAVYLLPIIYSAYFREPPSSSAERDDTESEAPAGMLVPTIVASLMTLALGLAATVPGSPLSLAQLAVDAFFR